MSLARYGFLPWLRQGISARINETDSLGDPVGKTGRPSVDISLSLTGVRVGAFSATTITEMPEDPDHPDKPVYKTLQLIGPGDITGLKSNAVVKTEPLPGVATFEPNYLPYIEFYEEDFPWRYTPAKASGDKLRPWLVLVVLETEEFERRFFPGAPLSAITHGTHPIAFPPKGETWAWAHVHVNRPLTGTDKPAALRTVVDENPNLASARLLCPRRLKANASYTGFLLPAFEQGRLAGLGAPPERIQDTDIQACAWDPHPADEYANLWPVYYEWDFRTGDLADFEYLVRRIEARVMEDPVGRRPIDLQEAGYELSYRGKGGVEPADDPDRGGALLLEGALQVIGATDPGRRFDFLNGGSEETEFTDELQTLLNLNEDLTGGTAGDDPLNQTLYLENGGKDDPIITPPLYGQWHAGTFRADKTKAGEWFHELNLDPRNRTAAGFGTLVVRKNQDEYMDRAWEQVGDVIEAQRRIRQSRFAAEVGQKLQTAYFDKMDNAAYSAFSSSVHARSRFSEDDITQEETVLEVIRHRRVQPPGLRSLLNNQQSELDQAKIDLAEARTELLQILNDIDAKEAQIAATEQRIADLEAEIAILNQEIAALDGQIAAKQVEIEAKNIEISGKQNEIADLEDEIEGTSDEDDLAELQAQLTARQAELEALEGELAELEGELASLQQQRQQKVNIRQQKQDQLTQEQANLAQQQSELQQLNEDRVAKENEISNLENLIDFKTSLVNSLSRLYLPSTSLRQDYRRLARPNSPVFRRIEGSVQGRDALQELSTRIDLDEAPDTVENIPETFTAKAWNDLLWGAALFSDPPVDEPQVEVVALTTTSTIRANVQTHIRPADALKKRLQTQFQLQTAGAPEAGQPPKPLLTYPEFREAMYAALAEISSELVLPNVQLIPMDTFSLLEVNQRFIESYLVGLNHEMARELLWREYPTDQRGSYFRRFWDDLDNLAATAPPPDIKLLTELDQPLGQNVPDDRDIPPPDPDDPHVVFVIRSELLKKFPNALIFMQRARWAENGEGEVDKTLPRQLTTGKDAAQRKMPIFKASIYPEVSFYGFPITVDESVGDEDDPGWFFVVQERPGEPRFGMDISKENETDTFESIGEWNDLAWPMVTPNEQGFIQVSEKDALGKPPKAGVSDQYTWAANGAHMAGILFQLPFMVAVHATDMIKLPD